ncbi:36526_t:CDS:2, partial [Gigaspora margarita]
GEIGNGSFGRVFKVYSKNMKGFVALKALHNDPTDFETPIDGTPVDFLNLYFKAWDGNPVLRPTIKEVCKELDRIKLN